MEERVERLEQQLTDNQRDVAMLVHKQAVTTRLINFLGEERTWMDGNLNNLGLAWFDQEAEYQVMRGNVDQLMAFQVALQHRPGNPIVVDDDDDTMYEDVDGPEDLEERIVVGELIPFDVADEGRLLMGGEDLPDYAE